jgi:hypothetical protein
MLYNIDQLSFALQLHIQWNYHGPVFLTTFAVGALLGATIFEDRKEASRS